MWDRKTIKKRAATLLPKNYWMFVAVSAIAILLLGGIHMIEEELHHLPVIHFLRSLAEEATKHHVVHFLEKLLFFFGHVVEFPIEELFDELRPYVTGEETMTVGIFFRGIGTALLAGELIKELFVLATEFLVGLPYEVGMNRYFMKTRQGEKVKFTEVFHGFKSSRGYKNIVLAQVLREVLTFLFKLLLFFPGVRHHYELFCVPFILAENPNMGWRHAHHLSEKMTHGYKWKLFCLEYSFLGWMILDALSFHLIGIFYLKPRMHATFAEAYAHIREKAFEEGIVTAEELPGVDTAVVA